MANDPGTFLGAPMSPTLSESELRRDCQYLRCGQNRCCGRRQEFCLPLRSTFASESLWNVPCRWKTPGDPVMATE